MSATGLTPQGLLSLVVVGRDGRILDSDEAFAWLRGTSMVDRAAPDLRERFAEWVRTVEPPDPYTADASTFTYRGRRDGDLPLLVRCTPVSPPTSQPAPPDRVLLAHQRLGGPVARTADHAVRLPPRSGWDHVLNHDVRVGLRQARHHVGLYRRDLAGAPGPSAPDPALLDTGLRALANAERAMEEIVRYHRLDVDLLTMGPVSLAELVVGAAGNAAEQLDQLTREGYDDLAGGLAVQGPGRAEDLTVTGHGALLEWLLAELMVNARKFAGGDTVVYVSGAEADGWVTVRISNTGTPIDADRAEDAFALGRVLQGRGERPGVGLGLPLARRVAARHAGRLAFVPGAGDTTVELELVAATPGGSRPGPMGRR